MPAQTVRSLKGSSVYRLARHFQQQINMHASSHFVIPWIQAESAGKAGRTEPTVRTTKTEPTVKTAKTEPSIKAGPDEKTGQTGKTIKTERPISPTGTIVMSQAEELAHAKRRAAISYSRMASSPGDDRATAQVNSDEMDVLNARINLLQTFLRQGHDAPPMCLPVENVKGPRVCVVYDRIRCEGELELGPMQSSMSWAVQGAEDTVMHLLSSDDNAGQTEVIRSLLAQVHASAPKKHCLAALQGTLEMHSPDHMVLKGTEGGQTRILEGLGAGLQGCPTPPLFRVIWGALDLDILEGWQNPSTNAAIRLSILDTAQQAAREARQTKAPFWANVAYMQIRVFHDDECHRLTLRPFSDSESCTVSHLQYSQSVFDDSGPERGILNLVADPSSIHAMPLGKILPMQAYVCLGAHRKSRLNEAQLNYVHAQGLLAHGFDTQLLPAQVPSMHSQGSSLPVKTSMKGSSLPAKMPHAKSTRVTGDKLDVLASSFHIADQVYTTITVVQYPPFGVQFEAINKHVGPRSQQNARPINMPLGTYGDGTPDERDWHSEWDAWNNQFPDHEEEPEEEIPGPPSEPPNPPPPSEPRIAPPQNKKQKGAARALKQKHKSSTRTSEPREHPTELPLYKEPRDFDSDNIPMSVEESKKHARPGGWGCSLRVGEHYFVDGVTGDPYDLSKRFILFELDNGMRYEHAENTAKNIKTFFKQHRHSVYNSAYPFYWNIQMNNARRYPEEDTLAETWQKQWQDHISRDLDPLHAEIQSTGGTPRWFWYTEDESQWDSIIDPGSKVAYYAEFSKKLHDRLVQQGKIQAKPNFARRNILLADQLPLPKTQMTARVKSDLTVAQLQSRVNALETRLRQSRQEENTQHLLEAVLEKLEATEV